MHQNNLVYKGYRLSAKVSRSVGAAATSGAPMFVATVVIVPADSIQDSGDEYPVPAFQQGGSVYNPREAVHMAIMHGCEIVDALMAHDVVATRRRSVYRCSA